MVISNFTLYAQNKKGSKMSFSNSAPAVVAEPIYDYFVQTLRDA
jgi:D-Tyr-tRNAtyr deacylase